jgi:aminoglycoside phosphotransferase (APT) family kinase protein
MRKSDITPELIRRLLREQFPQWASLPLEPVERDGWDNLTMRLGSTMSVRLPSADIYSSQVAKEHRWLPVLRDHLPAAIPNPVGRGVPGCGFPRPWSVCEWLPGQEVTPGRVTSMTGLARDLSQFLTALQAIGTEGGPAAGEHSFYRGASPAHWDDSARRAIAGLAGIIDAPAAVAVWEAALHSRWTGPPVWFHGDVTAANLLVRDGTLSAVIDFGTCGTGDPACDLVIAWSLFEGESRDAFRRGLPAIDEATWARARGWMLWKAAVTLRNARAGSPAAGAATTGATAGLEFGWRAGALGMIEDVLDGR